MLFFVACISCITVACDSDDDGTKGDDNKFPAPEVTFSAITGVSFTAGWNALETADSYRYEVSYEKDGQVVAVAAQNTEVMPKVFLLLSPVTIIIILLLRRLEKIFLK